MTTSPRALAERLAASLLAADPFAGSSLGLREYDALVPDPSSAAEDSLALEVAAVAAASADATATTSADRITLAAVRAACERKLLELSRRSVEYTVTPLPIAGPPALFALAARTVLVDAQASEDYLTRLRAAPGWIDGVTQRLAEGMSSGRVPVASLVEQALAWADAAIAEGVPGAFTTPTPPDAGRVGNRDVDGGHAAWRAAVDDAVGAGIVPALQRWRDRLAQVLPRARPDEAAGIHALPDGANDYRRAVAFHTTLELDPLDLHEVGRSEVARLETRAVELGARLGLDGLPEIVAAVRASSSEFAPDEALRRARAAVARAEERAGELMPPPLPGPCAVEAMPPTVARSGMAPHYTRPRRDGSRPGTYWFNTARPTAGTGWDLEAVAFHETVPGHHSQLARAAVLPELPLLQQMSVTVHAEGWGLYAERLAGELGLFSDVRAELGAVYIELHRAARLVVDTGLHALGWTRQQARGYLLEHVALPEGFLSDETDRYVAWPGQALAYQCGLREIVRLRDEAQGSLGARFALPQFHAALLDSGSVPMPVLATIVAEWTRAPA